MSSDRDLQLVYKVIKFPDSENGENLYPGWQLTVKTMFT